MTEAKINTQNTEITRNYISHLLEQLTVDYQNTKAERKQIASLSPVSEEEFSVLEEIELLTVDIRGYASQIQARGWIDKEQEAIERLQNIRVFDGGAIAQFNFTTKVDYQQIKAYLRMLDYLRLLMIEYLRYFTTAS
ncbi:hypothetical protein [Argonema galeatum]|uniref:hypothetical protein n=1 Tax=Argonema galeatum TaxID=2942762 RepID=UPI002012F133|nr:hypothetical protein [Argonema galeatum]MCL1464734.1 hypothetical protein [Argonema galeatum A003/A1]